MWMGSCSWPAMNVPFRFAELATSMSAKKEAKFAPSARLDLNVSRVLTHNPIFLAFFLSFFLPISLFNFLFVGGYLRCHCQVVLELRVMKKKTTLTMWTTSSILKGGVNWLRRLLLLKQCFRAIWAMAATMILTFLMPIILCPKFLFLPMVKWCTLLLFNFLPSFKKEIKIKVSLTCCLLQVDDIPPEQHALVPSFMGGGGKRIHPLPFSDPNLPGNRLD